MRECLPSLSSRIEQARSAYESCTLCPHSCEVNRHQHDTGFCRLGAQGRIYREYLHFGEEAPLCPSYTVYLTGCSLRCLFCSEWDKVVRPQQHGNPLIPAELAQRIDDAIIHGAQSVNFVGGDPGVNLLPILETLSHMRERTRVVWNSNLLSDSQALTLLSGLVDIWLIDLKFGSPSCASSLSGTDQTYDDIYARLQLLRDRAETVWIRHLVMPGHVDCCTLPVLRRLAKDFPTFPVNVMTHFLPVGAPNSPLRRSPAPEELSQVKKWLQHHEPEHWMWNGNSQESTSSRASAIPSTMP